MNWVDLVIVGAVGLSMLNGYRRGALMQVFSWGGFFSGIFLSGFVAPPLVRAIGPRSPTARAGIGLFLFLVIAFLVEALVSFGGSHVVRKVTHIGARKVDAVIGSALASVLVVIAAWLVSPMASRQPELARDVKDSAILGTAHGVLSDPPDVLAVFGALLGRTGFPDVFAQFNPSLAPGVAPPPKELARDREVLRAARLTYKVESDGCGGRVDGSGFPVDDSTVITAAHVVAGTRNTRLFRAESAEPFPARVVYIDTDTDIAVLHSPTMPEPTLPVEDQRAERRTDGAAIGYPGGGERTITPARVRDRISNAQGYDIYADHRVGRTIYVLRGTVRKGNSGGPFVDTDGRVRGMIFAASAEREEESYALAETEIDQALDRTGDRTRAVDTKDCASL